MPKKEEVRQEAQELSSFEEWARTLGTPAWLLAAVRARARWPQGKLLAKEEYEKAVQDALKEVIRNG